VATVGGEGSWVLVEVVDALGVGAKVDETETAVMVDEGVSVKTKGTSEVELVELEVLEELEEEMLVVVGALVDEAAAELLLEAAAEVSSTDDALEVVEVLVVEAAAVGLLEVVLVDVASVVGTATGLLLAEPFKPRSC